MRNSVSTDFETFGRQFPQLGMAERGASQVWADWNIESASDLPGSEDLGQSQIVSLPVIPTRCHYSWFVHIFCAFPKMLYDSRILPRTDYW